MGADRFTVAFVFSSYRCGDHRTHQNMYKDLLSHHKLGFLGAECPVRVQDAIVATEADFTTIAWPSASFYNCSHSTLSDAGLTRLSDLQV